MSDPITPNMNMRLPTPGVTEALGVAPAGESWLELLNAAISSLDQHTHASGRGVPVPTNGINLNADLPFNSRNAITLRSARFDNQAAALADPADVRCVYVVGGDLYFNDGTGSAVRLTSGGAVAGTPGSISGLVSPASVAYSGGAFQFQSDAGVFAHVEGGNAIVHEPVLNGKAATLKVPAGLSANYSLTLFGGLPASTKIVSLDSTGALAAAYDLDNTTLEWSSNLLRVKGASLTTSHLSASAGILGTQLASQAVDTAQLKDAGVTRAKMGAVGQQVSASSGTWTDSSSAWVDVTNMSVTLTTTGRPVLVFLAPDGGASPGNIGTGNESYRLVRGATVIGQWQGAYYNNSKTQIDVVGAGTYTYKFQANAVGLTASVSYMRLVAFEL